MLRVMLVDDNNEMLEMICSHLRKFDFVDIVYKTNDPYDFLDYVEDEKPDLCILDIDMPGMSGIELSKKIREKDSDIMIVFVTSHLEFHRDAFDVYALDYIAKPVDFERLSKTLDRIKKNYVDDDNFIEVKAYNTTQYIPTNSIYMIEANNKKTNVYLENEILEADHGLKYFMEEIHLEHFMKTSRFNIVNLKKVHEIENDSRTSYSIVFKNIDFRALLSKKLYDEFREKIKNL